ncbi:MAG: hypothetical protein QW197_01875 [Candidatus Aenigmatarchaeota archaeon]
MNSKTIIKTVFVGIVNFILFPLFPLLLILYSYGLYECKFFGLDFCSTSILFFDKTKIYLLLILGVLIVILSIFSNLFTGISRFLSSILYSILILMFLIIVMNFGYLQFSFDNFFGIDRVKLKLEYQIILYLLILAVVIDIIRKIIVYFLEERKQKTK